MPEDRMSHRAPWECTFAKEQRSRCLPGKKPRTDHKYFEVLSLCILQAGLSWASVRRSWPRYRSAFLNFEIAKLARATPAALLRRPGAQSDERNRRTGGATDQHRIAPQQRGNGAGENAGKDPQNWWEPHERGHR